MGLTTSILVALLCAHIQEAPPPSADHIRVIQEAQSTRTLSRNPRRSPSAPAPTYRAAQANTRRGERAELKRAIEQFVRKRSGQMVDVRKRHP